MTFTGQDYIPVPENISKKKRKKKERERNNQYSTVKEVNLTMI